MIGPDPGFWRGKRVLVTGHTGFKGGWLSLWLLELGAEVQGYALAPSTEPNFFDLCGLASRVHHRVADVCHPESIDSVFEEFRPEIVFHMAAQSLVRPGYRAPVETFATNVMGTVHVLDAVRRFGGVGATLVVTSDKAYAERSEGPAYRESDPLGGHDPYSASKAAAECVASAYGRAFLAPAGQPLATLRAGNVIGGGDWAIDRLVPDLIRGFLAGENPVIRSPSAVRPWQHVLEPLAGYLLAAEALWGSRPQTPRAWNFGPAAADMVPVEILATRLRDLWGGDAGFRIEMPESPLREASTLRLDAALAAEELGWTPRWSLDRALAATVDWYRAFAEGGDMVSVSLAQIAAYGRAEYGGAAS